MNSEIEQIFRILSTPKSKENVTTYLYSSDLQKFSLFGFLALLSVSLIVKYIEPISHLAIFAFLISYAFILVYNFSMYFTIARKAASPVNSHIEDLIGNSDYEQNSIELLTQFSIENLSASVRRIEHERKMISNRVGFFIGPMEKLGMVPTVIVLYGVYAKAASDPWLESVPWYVFAALAGIYAGAVLAWVVSSKMAHMLFLLNEAIVSLNSESEVDSK